MEFQKESLSAKPIKSVSISVEIRGDAFVPLVNTDYTAKNINNKLDSHCQDTNKWMDLEHC